MALAVDNKFKAGHYDTVDAFQADFKRMINNCYAFNGKDHVVSALGRRLETSFGRELKIARKVAKDKSLGESDFKPVNSDEENAMYAELKNETLAYQANVGVSWRTSRRTKT